LKNWYQVVDKASWNAPADVKRMFGATVDFIGDNRLVFDIGGNKYRLIAWVNYHYGVVYVRFIGTHRAYDAIDPQTV